MTVIPGGMGKPPEGLGRNVPPAFRGFRRNSFAPLFDIVKTTTTEGSSPFYRRRKPSLNSLGQPGWLHEFSQDAKPGGARCGGNIIGQAIDRCMGQHAKLDGFLEMRRNSKFI
jgi:hypothetical protein